jgi:hypothetical protein
MKKIKLFLMVLFVCALLFACVSKVVLMTESKTRALSNPEALKVSGFKYLLDRYDYGLEGKYEANFYNPFEKLPNVRDYNNDYYVLELYPDSRNYDILGYVVELADVNGKVFEFRFYPGKPAFLAVKKHEKLHKFILYSVKINGNYFERGVYLSQSYWDHLVVKEALNNAKMSFRIYSNEELEESFSGSSISILRTNELLLNKQKYIWKLVALRHGEEDLPFIYVDVHDSAIYMDEEDPAPSVRKRYDYYCPGWSKMWSKEAVVYGILCEVPEEGFNNLFKDRSFPDRVRKPEAKKEIKDIKMTYFFQVIF